MPVSLLLEIQRRGTTVIVATHDEGLMEQFPGRILTLNGGKLVGDTAEKSTLSVPDSSDEEESSPDTEDEEEE